MKQNKDGICRMDVDKAWNSLYARLEKEQLLTIEAEHFSYRKRKIPLQWVAAAAICAGIIFSAFYFSQNRDHSALFLTNTDSSTLVSTLEDGSIVYLASQASLCYPSAFAVDQRKVELNGNALFCVAKDEKRPFVVKINGIRIEVVGTIFAVQSSPDHSFELSVKQGKVNVQAKDDPIILPVESGETVQLNTGKLSKSRTEDFRLFRLFTDKMRFKDEKLDHIVQAINTLYGSPILIADESIHNRTLTVTFENNSVETMTELICMALHLEQINKQDTIFIRSFIK
ncbi:MAG: FecR domain-containing protein [Candidatus Azobacteroides sp.]|nr:FecR domain-containing protein [Candidatus Azobacteroides sp.]